MSCRDEAEEETEGFKRAKKADDDEGRRVSETAPRVPR